MTQEQAIQLANLKCQGWVAVSVSLTKPSQMVVVKDLQGCLWRVSGDGLLVRTDLTELKLMGVNIWP